MTTMTRTSKSDKEGLQDHLLPENGQSDANYLVWKKAKVEKALEQSRDRSKLISADKVWERLGLED